MLDLSDPQSWNAYLYVNNNPLARVDPDGRGFFAKLKNLFFWDVRGEDEDVQREEQKRRDDMLRYADPDGGVVIQSPVTGQGVRVYPREMNRANVWLWSGALYYWQQNGGGYHQLTPEQWANVIDTKHLSQAASRVRFSSKQIRKKFKHAEDFGVEGNYNPANASRFQQAIEDHLSDPATREISGTFRGQTVTHYVNPQTGLNVMKDAAGNFLSGWKLSSAQLRHLLITGKL